MSLNPNNHCPDSGNTRIQDLIARTPREQNQNMLLAKDDCIQGVEYNDMSESL